MEIPPYSGNQGPQIRQPSGPGPQAYQPNGSNLGYRLGEGAHQFSLLGGIWLGVKAGQNHFARTGDAREAMWLGAIAGRRWFFWILTWILTVAQALIGVWFVYLNSRPGYVDYVNPRGTLSYAYGFTIGPCIMAGLLLVLYNRNIDFSLFKRRLLYWLIKPVQMLLDWIPNFVLYSMFFVLPILIASLTD